MVEIPKIKKLKSISQKCLTIRKTSAIIFNCADVFCEFCHAIQEDFPVITELASQDKVVGVKQSRRAIREGRAKRVYLAVDADPAITDPVAAGCKEAGIPVETGHTMAQLGQACRITVGASVVAVI